MLITADHTRDLALSDQEIGQRIRQFRILRGLSQAKLGVAIGVTFQQVQKYETGKNRIAVSKLLAIAKALRLDVAQILHPDMEMIEKLKGLDKPVVVRKTARTASNKAMVSALIRYFNAIPNDEMRGEVITHAKRLASLNKYEDQ